MRANGTTEEREARRARLLSLLGPVHDRLRAFARRLEASDAEGDDLFQDALLRAYERLDELRDAERFSSWLAAILCSAHRTRSRGRFWRRFFSFESVDEGAEMAAPGPGADVELESAARLRRALATLSPEAREAIVAFEVEGWTLEELAAVAGEPVGTVKARLSRAREKLRAFYEREAARAPWVEGAREGGRP